jgi:hypothetical protein
MIERDDTLLASMRGEAERVAAELKKDPHAMAVILTGPLALGIAREKAKLYFAVVTDAEDGVIEHHFLDEGWAGVRRPIEMGKFPLAVARYLMENGYHDMVSYKSIEAFRCGEVLYERDRIGTEMVEDSKRHIPGRTFIGESLHGAVSALDDAVSLMKNGDYRNAVLVAREAVTKAVGMVVSEAGEGGGAPFLEAADQVLPPEQLRRFREVMGVREVDPGAVREHARRAREFAAYALREIGVNPESIFGPRGKGRAS